MSSRKLELYVTDSRLGVAPGAAVIPPREEIPIGPHLRYQTGRTHSINRKLKPAVEEVGFCSAGVINTNDDDETICMCLGN